jgi:predicted phosphodiesterase
MRVGIISDVHGNLEALEQVLRAVEAEHCDEVVSLGDTVGYGPQPDACVAAISRVAVTSILGNHDDAVLGRTDPVSFNEFARKAVLWTRRAITVETRAELERYELYSRRGDTLYVHASIRDPQSWEYILYSSDAESNFSACTERICFIGHSHVPGGFERYPDGFIAPIRRTRIMLDDQNRYIINAGSVGQPRDGDPRACFALYDQENGVVEFRRVIYNVQRTQGCMRALKLPEFLAKRLQFGH